MAQPIRFEQDPDGPDGAGMFEFDSGQSVYAYEPEIASRLGELSARLEEAPDDRTADLTIDAPEVAGSTADQELSDALARQATQFGAATNESIRNVPPPTGDIRAPNQPPPPSAAPPPAAAPGMQQVDLSAQPAPQPPAAPAPPPMVYQAPRAGGYVPSAQSTVTENGPGYDPEMAKVRGDLNREVQRANMAQFDAQAAAAENQAAQLRAQIPTLQMQEAAAKRELAAKQDVYKQERAKAQTYVNAAYERKINPRQIYQDAGVAGSIALVIGQALGAFGAAITHTDNFAQRMVDQALQQSIAAQQHEIESGRVGAENMLAQITQDLGGDIEQAKATLEMAARKNLEAQILEQKSSAESLAAQRAADIWLAQNQQAFMAAEQRFYEASIGKTTTTTNTKYQSPQAGGMRAMSLKEQVEQKKARDFLEGRTDASGKIVDTGADPKAVERYAKRRLGSEDMLGQVNDLVSLTGGKVENGKVQLGEGAPIVGIPGVGPIESRLPTIGKGAEIRQQLRFLASSVVKDRSGAAVTDKERADLMKIVEGGAKTESELRRGIQIIYNYAERNKRNVDASAPSNVRQTYREQGREAVADEYERSDESDVERY